MEARNAIEGGLYNLPARGSSPAYKAAVFNGWNHSGEWLLFVVYDEQGKRKMKTVMPTEQIQPIN